MQVCTKFADNCAIYKWTLFILCNAEGFQAK